MIILKWFIIGIAIWCVLLLALMPFCMVHGAEYGEVIACDSSGIIATMKETYGDYVFVWS